MPRYLRAIEAEGTPIFTRVYLDPKRLGIKQQVAYELARRGILKATADPLCGLRVAEIRRVYGALLKGSRGVW